LFQFVRGAQWALRDLKLGSWVVERRRIVDVDALLRFDSVRDWYYSRAEGDGRKSAIYRFAAYLRWRARRGYSVDPDG